MSIEFTFIDSKHFSNASIDKRKAFLRDITQAAGHIEKLTKDEIIELCALNIEFKIINNMFSDIVINCNKSFLDNECFVNTLFFLTKPKVIEVSKLFYDQLFRERYDNSLALSTCINKFATYNMLDSEHITLDSSTLKDACDGSIKWPFTFVINMQNSLSRSVIDNNVCFKFADRLFESLKLDTSYPWDKKLSLVLNINIQTLKRMCSSKMFKEYLELSYQSLQKEYLDDNKPLPKHLLNADATLKTVINYSKLIKSKDSKRMIYLQ